MDREIRQGSLTLTVGSLAPPYVIKFDERVISFQIIIVILKKKIKKRGKGAGQHGAGRGQHSAT